MRPLGRRDDFLAGVSLTAIQIEWAEKAGVGYTIPTKPISKTTQLVYNGPQNAVAVEREKVA